MTVMGLRTNYITAGQGETVLLLHGWGSSIVPYTRLISLLQRKYFVIALDLPGFGGTQEPPEPWDVDAYVDFILEFLKSFAPERISIVGHSFGGRCIIKMMQRELPFRVTKLALVDSAGIKPQPSKKKSWRSRVYKLGKWFYTRKPVAKLFPNALENLKKKFGSADYAAASPMMRQCLIRVVNEDLTPLLPDILPPTLLVWGENDTATPLSDGQQMEKAIPNAGLAVIKNAGHYSFLDQPLVFESIMASYFEVTNG